MADRLKMGKLKGFAQSVCKWLPEAMLAAFAVLSYWVSLAYASGSTLSSENTKHLSKVFEMARQLQDGQPWNAVFNTITYPPVLYANALLWFKSFGVYTEAAALMSLSVFLLAASASVYALTRRRAGRIAACAAAISFWSVSAVYVYMEGFLPEYALGAAVIAAFTAITGEKSALNWVLLTAACALGMLTKWTFFTYILPAWLIIFVLSFRHASEGRAGNSRHNSSDSEHSFKRAGWLLSSAAAALMLSAPWYAAGHGPNTNFGEIFSHFGHSRSSEFVIQSYDPIFTKGFRASLPYAWQKTAPASFVLYLREFCLPPHLGLMLAAGLIITTAGCFVRRYRRHAFCSVPKAGWLSTENSASHAAFNENSTDERTAERTKSAQAACPPENSVQVSSIGSKLSSCQPSPELLITVTLAVILLFYSLYPSPALFVPEKSVRHLAPLAPLAAALSFMWLKRGTKLEYALLILCGLLGLLSASAWYLPQNGRLHSSRLLGPGSMGYGYSFRDPLGIVTAPKLSGPERAAAAAGALMRGVPENELQEKSPDSFSIFYDPLCRSRQNSLPEGPAQTDFRRVKTPPPPTLIVHLTRQESFDPFLAALYAETGARPLILQTEQGSSWLDPLTQIPLPVNAKFPPGPKIIAERNEIVWTGFGGPPPPGMKLSFQSSLPAAFLRELSAAYRPETHKPFEFTVMRAGQKEKYRISVVP